MVLCRRGDVRSFRPQDTPQRADSAILLEQYDCESVLNGDPSRSPREGRLPGAATSAKAAEWPGCAPASVSWHTASSWRGWLFSAFSSGLVALYAVVAPVSTLMLGRTLEGKSTERIYVRLKNIAPAAVAA